MNSNKGTLTVIASGIMWGLISIFVRKLSAAGFDSFRIMCLRAWQGAIIMFALLAIFKRDYLKIRIKDIWMFMGSGIISLTAFSYCYFTTIVNSGAAVAVVLLYTSPIFVMLLSAVFFKERITKRKVMALAMTFTGCVFVAGIIGGNVSMSYSSLLLGLGSGLGYAFYSIFAGFAIKKYSSLTVTFYTFVFSGLTLMIFFNPIEIVKTITLDLVPYLIGMAVICTVLPYICYTVGLSKMEKSRAAVVVTVEPLVGTLLGLIVFHEEKSVLKIIGIILIFAAVIMLGMEDTNQTKQ